MNRKVFLCLALPAIGALLSTTGFAQSTQYARQLSSAFNSAARVITPSVVTVSSSKTVRGAQNGKNQLPDIFRDFFGPDFNERYGNPFQAPEGNVQQGMGSGVIVDSKGYILTNNHVIGEADEVKVSLSDKRKFDAEIVGTDPSTDLAVIKIKGENFTAADLGDSDELQIGDWVVAAGNPFGLDNTITTGIVSAKGRSIMGGNMYEDFIQTDAAINPGNSGGPLVDLDGKVVGINTAIFSRSGGYMGIGFAIPINMAKEVMNSLISDGKVIRGWLGVGIQNLTEELAESFDYPSTEGALVSHIQQETPAAKAGIRQGDIIIRFNGERIKDVNELRNKVAATTPGKDIDLDVIREGRKTRLSVKIGEMPGKDQELQSEPEVDGSADLGVSIEPLSAEIAKQLGTSRRNGVVVTAVNPGSLAARAGFRRGDIIVRAGSKNIETIRDFHAAISKDALAKGIRMVVESQGMERFIFVRSSD